LQDLYRIVLQEKENPGAQESAVPGKASKDMILKVI
jgi:hypothetical protein